MPLRLRQLDRLFARFCCTGEAEALAVVFDRTAGELLHVAAWLTRNRADADDLLQRTFLTAIEQRHQFAHERRVQPWLLGILTNHARNLRRERQRHAAPPLAAPPTPADDPVQAAADAEFAAWLQSTGQAIGPPYEQVLALHLEEGLNAGEIAQRLGRPAGTVRTQLARALAMLRSRLPKGFVAAAMAWRVQPTALAAVKATVLGAARTVPAVGAGAAIVTAATLEAVLVAKKLWLVVPFLAIALAVSLLRPWSDAPAPARSAAVTPNAVADFDHAARESSTATPAAAQRVDVTPAAEHSSNGRWLTVRSRDSGAAVPGAEVWILSNAETASNEDRVAPPGQDVVLEADLLARIQARGRQSVADVHGRIALPPPSRQILGIAAASAGQVGTAEISLSGVAPPDGDVLWLERDDVLTVRVTDPNGTAIGGVPIAFGYDVRNGTYSGRDQRAVARSNRDGMATLRPRQWVGQEFLGAITGSWVTFALPGFEGPGVAVDLRVPNPAPIDLVLPDTGRIVVCADASLADGETSAGLLSLEEGGRTTHFYGEQRLAPGGRAVFEHVRLGCRFRVGLTVGRLWTIQEVTGPAKPGETIRVRLDLPEHLALRGRATTSNGPLARQRLHFDLLTNAQIAEPDGRLHGHGDYSGTVRTDAEGSFCLCVHRSLAGASSGVLRLRVDADDGSGPATQVVLEPIPADLDHDLGEVRLRESEVQLDGCVVFDDGSPCFTAEMWIAQPDTAQLDYVARQRRLGVSRVEWHDERFAIRGGDLGEQVLLNVRSAEAVPLREPVLALLPGRGLRIVLQRAGALTATLRAYAFSPNYIDAWIGNAAGTRFAGSGWEPTGTPNCIRRSFGGLPPGTYEFCYGLRTEPERMVHIPDVVVRAGATTNDPRLQDLTIAARTCRVELLDAASGERVDDGRCAVILQQPVGQRVLGFDGMHGVVQCIVQGEPDALCIAPGREPTRVRLLGSEQQVSLPRSIVELTIDLALPSPPLPADSQLQLRLDPELSKAEQLPPETRGGGGTLAEFLGKLSRVVDIAPGEPLRLQLVRARYRLTLTLQRGGRTVAIDGLSAAVIDLQTATPLDLTIAPEGWQDAVSRLETR